MTLNKDISAINNLGRVAFCAALFILLNVFNSAANGQFELKGKAAGLNGAKLVLLAIPSSGSNDTLGQNVVRNGGFHFSGKLALPVMAYLINSSTKQYSVFWLVPGSVEIDIDTARVSENSPKELVPIVRGSKENDLYKIYQEQMKFLSSDLTKESKILAGTKDPEAKKKIEEKVSDLREEYIKQSNSFTADFAKENNSSFCASYLFTSMINDHYSSIDKVKSIMDNFTEEVKKSTQYKKNAEKLALLLRIQPGKPAPDFTLHDPDGKDFSLSSLKGKVVLIDFWASWCLPCIASIPSMKKLYDDYKAKGFEILGVTNDSKEEAWLKSMQQNSLPWKNVIDRFPKPPAPRGPAEVATLYSIGYLPTTILIDRNGVIVAKNLHEKELEEKIKEIL